MPGPRRPIGLTLAVAIACFVMPWVFTSPALDQPWLDWLGLGSTDPVTNDYVPIFPWFGFVLSGVAVGKWLLPLRETMAVARWRATNWLSKGLVWAGRKSLPIYLTHQIILLAVLQTIPAELYEAATVDGANAWQRFWHVTLPHLVPTILFLLLLRTIWMSNHIDMIFIMTRGGPGFSNYTEAVYSFMLTQQFEIGYSSAVAVALAVCLVAASAFYVRHLARTVLSR